MQEGDRLYRRGMLAESAQISQQALAIAHGAGDRMTAMQLHGRLAASLRGMGQYIAALDHARKQLVLAQELDLRLGQAQARNAIALALIALGDMEASRRELDAALELCHAVRPAVTQMVREQLTLLLCTTFANLADHSVKNGQMQEAMRWVRQLRRTDTACLDAHSQRVWTARAGSIQASIHARLGLTCLFGAAEGAVADSGSSEDECAQCSSEPVGKDLQWHRSESMEALLTRADVLGQAGNVTGMCELLLEASRRYMVETRELGKAISCLETACRVLQGSEATNILARSTMLLGAAHLLAGHSAQAVELLEQTVLMYDAALEDACARDAWLVDGPVESQDFTFKLLVWALLQDNRDEEALLACWKSKSRALSRVLRKLHAQHEASGVFQPPCEAPQMNPCTSQGITSSPASRAGQQIQEKMCSLQRGGVTTLIEYVFLDFAGLNSLSVQGHDDSDDSAGAVHVDGDGGFPRLADSRLLIIWVVSPQGELKCCRKLSLLPFGRREPAPVPSSSSGGSPGPSESEGKDKQAGGEAQEVLLEPCCADFDDLLQMLVSSMGTNGRGSGLLSVSDAPVAAGPSVAHAQCNTETAGLGAGGGRAGGSEASASAAGPSKAMAAAQEACTTDGACTAPESETACVHEVPVPFTAELYLWALSNEDTRPQTKLADALSARLKDIRTHHVLLEAAVAESSGDQPTDAAAAGLRDLLAMEQQTLGHIRDLEGSWNDLRRMAQQEKEVQRLIDSEDSGCAVTQEHLKAALRFTVENMSTMGLSMFGEPGRVGGDMSRDDGGLITAMRNKLLESHLQGGNGEVLKTIAYVMNAPWTRKMLETMLKEYRCVCRWLDLQKNACSLSHEALTKLKGEILCWGDLRELVQECKGAFHPRSTPKSVRARQLLHAFAARVAADERVAMALLMQAQRTLKEERLLKQLHRILIDPVLMSLDGVGAEELLIVADGQLSLVPWAALMDEKGSYMVEFHTLRIAPAVSVAAGLEGLKDRADSQRSQASEKMHRAVVVGNPWPVDPQHGIQALPHAEEEAAAAAAVLRECGGIVECARGADATLPRVTAMLHDADHVHMACHGLLDEQAMVLACDAKTERTEPTEQDPRGSMLSMHHVQEHVRLRPGCKVVLSACNTACGRVGAGEGVLGMARAFFCAGAQTVVVSLWSVSDQSTKHLMGRFYAALKQGQSVARALRLAMLQSLGRTPRTRPEQSLCADAPQQRVFEAGLDTGAAAVGCVRGEEIDVTGPEQGADHSRGARKDLADVPSPFEWAGFVVSGAHSYLT